MSLFVKSDIELKELKDFSTNNILFSSLAFYTLLIIYIVTSLLYILNGFNFFITLNIISILLILLILYGFKIVNITKLIIFFFIFVFVFLILSNSYLDFREIYKIEIFLMSLYLMYVAIKELPENFLYLFFSIFFKYHVYIVEKHDFFTNEIDYIYKLRDMNGKTSKSKKDRDKSKVVFFITPLIELNTSSRNYKKIVSEYIKLVFFWHSYKYNKVKLRATIPLFAFIFSTIFFIYALFILNNLNLYVSASGHIISSPFLENNFFKMSCVIVFSIILYYSMLYYLNKFLDPNYYLERINRLFRRSKINFKKEVNNNQKVILYLDKTFLISIYDKNIDDFVLLNSDKEFIDFVLNFYLDKEGRDYIINIFISVFMVIYIAIFVEVLVDNEVDKIIKRTNSIERSKY